MPLPHRTERPLHSAAYRCLPQIRREFHQQSTGTFGTQIKGTPLPAPGQADAQRNLDLSVFSAGVNIGKPGVKGCSAEIALRHSTAVSRPEFEMLLAATAAARTLVAPIKRGLPHGQGKYQS
jgi:hypothetical protein